MTLTEPRFTLLDFQVNPAVSLAEVFAPLNNRGILFVQPAGTGKTYVVTKALHAAWLKDYFINDPLSLKPFKTLIVTTAKVVTQFKRVLLQASIPDTQVTSHASLSSSFGDGLITWHTVMVQNNIDHVPIWDDDLKPDCIIVDECQTVKNRESNLAKIIVAAAKQGIKVVLMSATPFTRLSETYVTCIALGLCQADLYSHRKFCSNFTFTDADYIDYNAAAMARFNDYLVDRGLKIEAKNIKFAKRVFNKCRLINFESQEHQKMYEDAYEEYLRECAKQNKNTPQGRTALWVAMMKFRVKAENLRSGQMSKVAVEIATTQDKQVIIASNFISTLDIVKAMLIDHHAIPANQIAIIVGGKDCQDDIDAFQRGDKRYCLLSLKSGGAGLSLHHEAGYPNARPRYVILPPTWSAIELVQVLGRAHRITSISTTYQDIIWYAGTIEERVAEVVQKKMKSLKEIVSKRETWLDLFSNIPEEELREIEAKMAEEQDEKDEEGVSIIDSLPLDALEKAEDEEG